MANSISQIAAAMRADMAVINATAENIANAQTSGYRRKVAVQSAYDQFATRPPSHVAGPAHNDVQVLQDVTPGTLSVTHESMDIALDGPGMLVVQSDSGEQLTRGGRFHVNQHGYLVSENGLALVGASGPISMFGRNTLQGELSIGIDGSISVAGKEIDRLQIRENSTSETEPTRVMQGYLETSNVNSVTEMLKLIETVRHFETAQKILRTESDLQQQGIADLGKF